jgi:hypothetical protein
VGLNERLVLFDLKPWQSLDRDRSQFGQPKYMLGVDWTAVGGGVALCAAVVLIPPATFDHCLGLRSIGTDCRSCVRSAAGSAVVLIIFAKCSNSMRLKAAARMRVRVQPGEHLCISLN